MAASEQMPAPVTVQVHSDAAPASAINLQTELTLK